MSEDKSTKEFHPAETEVMVEEEAVDETVMEEETPKETMVFEAVKEEAQEEQPEEETSEEEIPEEEPDEPVKSAEDIKRIKRQKKRERKKKAKKIAGPALAILLVVAVSLVIFARSDFFTVDKIKVQGNDYYTNAQIKEICGAEKGMNIFSIHKRSMIKLLVSDPYILDAEIKRDLPDRLIIQIVESEERGSIYSDKNYYVIDSSGYVLRVSSEKPKDIPKITGFDVRSGKEGEALEVKEAKAFNETLSLINTSAKSTISYRKIKVKNGVCYAYVKKKLYIKGIPEDIEKCIKSGKLEAVLYDIYEKGVKHGRISVGSDDYCVFRP